MQGSLKHVQFVVCINFIWLLLLFWYFVVERQTGERVQLDSNHGYCGYMHTNHYVSSVVPLFITLLVIVTVRVI